MHEAYKTEAIKWNSVIPEGSVVELMEDAGTITVTRTRSKPWTLPCGLDLVKVKGKTGGYSLSRIFPVRHWCDECGVYPALHCVMLGDETEGVEQLCCFCFKHRETTKFLGNRAFLQEHKCEEKLEMYDEFYLSEAREKAL